MWLAQNMQPISKKWQHDPNIQNTLGYTVAMILAQNKQDIPEYWQHDPKIQNEYGETVALIYASQRRIPPKEWYHDKMLRCRRFNFNYCTFKYYTVQNLLQEQNINVPKQWKYIPINNDQDTQAMIQARSGKIPDKQYYHDPNIQNKQGWTVAMYIAKYCKQLPPEEWHHNPKLKNEEGYTTEDYLCQNGFKVPQQWQDGQCQ